MVSPTPSYDSAALWFAWLGSEPLTRLAGLIPLIAAMAAVALTSSGATGCSGSAGAPPTATVSETTVARSPGAPTAAPSLSPSAVAVKSVGEVDNGRVLTLQRGQRLRIVLHSTYWTFHGSSQPSVLLAEGPPDVNPQPSRCVTGGGCGTVTAVYVALSNGLATVTATRTSCGEAEGCLPSAGLWRVTVRVR
jgi:hypothetical protein